MSFNAVGTFGPGLGLARAAEQVRLTCVYREMRSSCAANGTYGDPGLCVTSPATRSRHPCFPTSLEEFGSPRPLLICCQFFPGPCEQASGDLVLAMLHVQCWVLP